MSGQHTPGPWEARGNSVSVQGRVDTYGGPVLGTILYAEPTVQSDGEGRTWSVAGDAEANARLASAAPEMLEALRKIERILVNRQPDKLVDGVAIAREAIAKAEGAEA